MLFSFVRGGLAILLRIFFRVKISGAENIPSEGAFIICANHIHTLDPGMVAISIRRRIYFIAKKELWEKRFRRPFLAPLGIFPVNRGSVDLRAYKHAIEILKSGNGLLVFSQGSRMKDLTEFKNGAAFFALKTGASIVPAGISGSYALFSKIRVNIGKPIVMDEFIGRKIKSDLVDEVMENVVECVKNLTL
jgi:1-acyl-sn-glycerol-3-phosphate acyltransferase